MSIKVQLQKIDEDFLKSVESCLKNCSNENPIVTKKAYRQDSVEIKEIVEALSSVRVESLIFGVGYVLKQLQPIILKYLENESAKEIIMEYNSKKITLKGKFSEKEMTRVSSAFEKIE